MGDFSANIRENQLMIGPKTCFLGGTDGGRFNDQTG